MPINPGHNAHLVSNCFPNPICDLIDQLLRVAFSSSWQIVVRETRSNQRITFRCLIQVDEQCKSLHIWMNIEPIQAVMAYL